MTRTLWISVMLLLASPAAAQDAPATQEPAPPPSQVEPPNAIDSQANPEAFDLARKKVVECEGEKFVFAWGPGARPTKVTLCSKKGATTEEMIELLEDSATKLENTQAIPEDRRTALVQQIRGKIAQLKGETAAAEPVPAPVAQAPIAAPAPPPPPASAPAPIEPTAAAPLPAKPRLSLECMTPGEFAAGGPCVTLSRDTILTVKAGEPLLSGLSLRFVRDGETRAEVALGAMRNGQSLRFDLPREVCRGVSSGELDIDVLRGGRSLDRHGPYLLRF
jgi:hypothetical protein